MRGVRVDFCPRSLPKVEQTALKLRIKTVKTIIPNIVSAARRTNAARTIFRKVFPFAFSMPDGTSCVSSPLKTLIICGTAAMSTAVKTAKRHCRNRKTVDFEICTVFDTVHSEQHGESNYDEYAHQKHGAFLRIHAPDFIEKVKLFRFFFFKSRLKRFACRVLKHIAPGQLIRYIGCRVIKRIFGGILRIICFAASVFHKKVLLPQRF